MRANKNVATREFGPSLLKDLTSGFTRQSVSSTPGIRTANPYENTRQPRPPRLTPLTHPQPVSPLQQQRPLVGDGTRLWEVWWVGDKFLSVLAEAPLHRLRRSFPASGEAAGGSSWDVAASPLVGKLVAKRTEGVFGHRRASTRRVKALTPPLLNPLISRIFLARILQHGAQNHRGIGRHFNADEAGASTGLIAGEDVL
ncbi:hypothetical protein MCEMIH15_01432 [Caulobacteraceae bacterium]